MNVKGHYVGGSVLDEETRCAHYHKEVDRISIKFYCCSTYYPCHQCHEEDGCGQASVWPKEQFDEKAVLCGACGNELTVNEYLGCESECPYCKAAFNPACSLHREFYFEK